MAAAKNYETRLFINNEFVDAKSGQTFSVYDPADDSLVTDKVQIAGEADVDAAVDAAHAAYKGAWGAMTGAARGACLMKFAELVEQKAAEVAPLETVSMGVPVAIGGMLMPMVSAIFKYYAGWADKISGEAPPTDDGTYKIMRYEPFGVCAGIGAWNATLLYLAAKAAPALAAGNTFVFKASELAPLAVLAVAPLIKEAGFPPGTINIINGDGKTGALLASHMKIGMISFTGSVPTGRKIQDAANKSNMKKVTLELGGKSPSVIFDDADIENALAQTAQSVIMLTGQACTAASRTYVQEGIADKFIAALKDRFAGMSAAIGDPKQPTTMFGPLASKGQFNRVMAMIESGKKEATLLTGGTRKGDTGNYVEPTIFLNPAKDAQIYKEEIFGPVTAVKTFKTEEEAIEMANDTQYGLAACVYTSSVSRALRVSSKLEAGTVTVNQAFMPSIYTAFGGYKQSGSGREMGGHGVLEYLQMKSVIINMAV
ncbi:aldehyde dehydrogenase [Rhizodiscina lignyota]|uniref:aldehyde dehydrogenase (NAD(+)) n=1 Tax=Rhizodiscina lignyota TaxID=1504668 RepID=A0A9P4IMN0_9PEZI|nr:aldehyde dehydrogenase [Rhizodiscina lignyota]